MERSEILRGQTENAHRPKSHQKHLEWTPSRLIDWGQSIGPNTGLLVQKVIENRPHPEQGYRSCLGLLRLSERYSKERLEAASTRAVGLRAYSYQTVKSILKAGIDQTALPIQEAQERVIQHKNIRGADYYRSTAASETNLTH